MNANRPILTLLVVALLVSPAALATRFTGYVKTYAVAQDELDIPTLPDEALYQSRNSARLMWDYLGASTAIQLHYEFGAVLNSRNLALPDLRANTENAWRLADIDAEPNDNPRAQLLQNLDRFNLQFNFQSGDLTIGRQAITFGMARIINPTDIFLPFDVRTLDTEYRTGVDGIRYQRPFGALGELDFGVILGDDADPDRSAAFFQLRTNSSGTDYQLTLAQFANESLAGGGIQTALGDVGYWLEVASAFGDENFFRLSTGIDYAFSENVFGMVEYHFNGAGAGDPRDYISNTLSLAYQSGAVFLLGRHYLIPAMSFQLTPLWSLGVQSIFNLDDESAFISVAAEYNLSTNIYVDVGYYHFIGAGIDAPPLTLNSEYGGSPNTLYASLRYYF